ncbi:MAG: polysulfide reductase NrfD [Deltaproteobacteria bacterium]|nr:polysulfide reductase NrfD [Deltaproteobacteria bacterium]
MKTSKNVQLNYILGFSSLGLLLGAVTVFAIFTEGHAIFNTSSRVAWGVPVATYAFFILTSTGLTFVASLAMVFGIKEYYVIAKRCVFLAVVTLIGGFISLGLEIGRPERMIVGFILTSNLTSPMWWMGLFYSLYVVFLAIKFVMIEAEDWNSLQSRYMGITALITVIVAHSTLGSVFGMMASRPVWYSNFMPIYFLATAFLSGLAFAIFFTHLTYFSFISLRAEMPGGVRNLVQGSLPKLLGLVTGIVLLFTVWSTITGLWISFRGGAGFEVFYLKVSSLLFQAEFWLGLVVPFLLMLSRWRGLVGVQFLASILVIIGLFLSRYSFVKGGQIYPIFDTWKPDILHYSPSLVEWGIVILAFSIVFFLYALGEKIFDLGKAPR